MSVIVAVVESRPNAMNRLKVVAVIEAVVGGIYYLVRLVWIGLLRLVLL